MHDKSDAFSSLRRLAYVTHIQNVFATPITSSSSSSSRLKFKCKIRFYHKTRHSSASESSSCAELFSTSCENLLLLVFYSFMMQVLSQMWYFWNKFWEREKLFSHARMNWDGKLKFWNFFGAEKYVEILTNLSNFLELKIFLDK